MDGRNSSFNGDEIAVQFSQLSCSSDQVQVDHHHHHIPNWENSLMGDQNSVLELSSIVPSLAISNNLVSTDGIVAKDQYSTKLNHFLMDQQVSNGLSDSGNSIQSIPNSGTFTPMMGSGKRSRVSGEEASGLEGKFSRLLRCSFDHETAEFNNAEEEDSGSNKIITGIDTGLIVPNGSNSRKRKEIAKGKAKDLSPSSQANDFKNFMRSQIIGDENNAVKLNENRINSRRSEPSKDYIHVRARRGQATDSHSHAERVRREKISKRMKLLQDLVPGCHKITGKAVMLDEIINYVQSLQRQVQFLSMKLANVNPRLDINVEALPSEDMLHSIHPATQSSFSKGMETQFMSSPVDLQCQDLTMELPPIRGCGEVQTVGDDLQSLVQTHFGKMQIQEMELSSSQSFHGSDHHHS